MTSHAYALVNGMQLLKCVLPTASEGMCTVEANAQSNLGVMKDHGRFEVSCLFYAETNTPERSYVGELIIDGEVVYLGQLPGGEGTSQQSMIVTRYVNEYPRVLQLRLRYAERLSYEHPDEALLLQELEQLLSDGTLFPPQGSAPHTNVHNRLKDLELYNRVVTQHYNGKWTAFLANHGDQVIMHKEPGAELHLVLSPNASAYKDVDQKAEDLRVAQEHEIVEYMIRVLSESDLEYRDLLERMGQLPAFTSQLAPSMTMLNRFLQANRDVFWVKKDPEHTTRVGLVRR